MMLAKMSGFLQFLLEARSELCQAWNDYICRGTHPGRPIVDFNDRGVVLALPVRGADGKDYDLEVAALWLANGWTITAGAYVDVEAGQKEIRKLPDRNAENLAGCLEHARAALRDLITFEDLIPGNGSSS
jgi:hypothetical protein